VIKGLIHAYLLRFDPKLPGFDRFASMLREMVGYWDWDWADRQRQHRMFEPAAGPALIARKVLFEVHPPPETLERLGLRGDLAAGGFAAGIFEATIIELQRDLERVPQLSPIRRVTDWALMKDGKSRFPKKNTVLIEALLLPWSAGAKPPAEIKTHIQEFLLATFLDPRLSPRHWNSVNADAIRVMMSWLARASLEVFLGVIDRTAAKQQWSARRRFWTAYFDAGVVADCWVVFGRNPAAIARQIADETNDTAMLSFGELQGGTKSADHAALLIRIGNLTIVEWSFNGYCRMWRRGNVNAPRFFRFGEGRAYGGADLADHCDFKKMHGGEWQKDVAEFIKAETGVRLPQAAYMPVGWRP
jgi:hypothetical protein